MTNGQDVHGSTSSTGIDPVAGSAQRLRSTARALIKRPAAPWLLLCVVILAGWAAPFVRLDGHTHNLYGLFATSLVRLPVLNLFAAFLAATFVAVRRLRTGDRVTLFVGLAMAEQATILLPGAVTSHVLLEGYWLSLAGLTVLFARLLIIEARFACSWSKSWLKDPRVRELGSLPTELGSIKGLWRPVLVALSVSLGLFYGLPALMGLGNEFVKAVAVPAWAMFSPLVTRLVLHWARGLAVRKQKSQG
jgi:hypothetical protein